MPTRIRRFLEKTHTEQVQAIKATVSSAALSSLKKATSLCGYDLRPILPMPTGIPDPELYRPLFSPWFDKDFQPYYATAAPRTLVAPDRCYVLCTLLRQSLALDGEVVECGVYRGGTAAMMAKIIAETNARKKLYLFDTFRGMPETDAAKDLHQEGDFSDTSLEEVQAFVAAPDIA